MKLKGIDGDPHKRWMMWINSMQSGVKAGDRIVVDGAFHLDNERKRLEQG